MYIYIHMFISICTCSRFQDGRGVVVPLRRTPLEVRRHPKAGGVQNQPMRVLLRFSIQYIMRIYTYEVTIYMCMYLCLYICNYICINWWTNR